MKEATGESGMTVITIVLVAAVLAAGSFIVPGILNGLGEKACVEGGGTWNDGTNECDYV